LLKSLLPKEVDHDKVEIWSEDESRVGQQGSLTRIWAKKGTRPRKVKQRQFISTYIYGAACHQTGQSYGMILPYANTDAMNIFLSGLSKEVELDKHVALIIDNAGWHRAGDIIVPSNITLVPLPPYAPELNAMEQVWEWMKSHFLYNQSYSDYEDIVNKLSYAWNQVSANAALVKSIVHREWTYL
jgi:transposase